MSSSENEAVRSAICAVTIATAKKLVIASMLESMADEERKDVADMICQNWCLECGARLPTDLVDCACHTAETPNSAYGDGELEASGWPSHLVKAACDDFDYALMLRTGDVLYFSSAKPDSPGWVTITIKRQDHYQGDLNVATLRKWGYPTFDRDVCIRLSDIVWVADAPHGS